VFDALSVMLCFVRVYGDMIFLVIIRFLKTLGMTKVHTGCYSHCVGWLGVPARLHGLNFAFVTILSHLTIF
jgi:hypothetical protein